MDIKTLTEKNPLADMFQKDVILWRHVDFSQREPELYQFHWEPAAKGEGFFARVAIQSDGFWEPCIMEPRNRGIALFIPSLPPESWTHIVIGGVSSAMKNPGRQVKGASVFGQIPVLYNMNSYLSWRRELAIDWNQCSSCEIERASELSNSRWLCGARAGDMRLIIEKPFGEDAYYRYTHLKLNRG
jgi:hypothetical protein